MFLDTRIIFRNEIINLNFNLSTTTTKSATLPQIIKKKIENLCFVCLFVCLFFFLRRKVTYYVFASFVGEKFRYGMTFGYSTQNAAAPKKALTA